MALAATLIVAGCPAACKKAEAVRLTAEAPDQAAFFALWQRLENALRHKDSEAFFRLSTAKRSEPLRKASAAQLEMAFELAVVSLPASPQPGELTIAGGQATMVVSGQDAGKPVKGQALFARENGEWKVDVLWRSAQ
jgi:hypothetical protein